MRGIGAGGNGEQDFAVGPFELCFCNLMADIWELDCLFRVMEFGLSTFLVCMGDMLFALVCHGDAEVRKNKGFGTKWTKLTRLDEDCSGDVRLDVLATFPLCEVSSRRGAQPRDLPTGSLADLHPARTPASSPGWIRDFTCFRKQPWLSDPCKIDNAGSFSSRETVYPPSPWSIGSITRINCGQQN